MNEYCRLHIEYLRNASNYIKNDHKNDQATRGAASLLRCVSDIHKYSIFDIQ